MSFEYASETSVSVEKSRAELESILSRYGADSFGYVSEAQRAMIGFRVKGRTVRFIVPLPDRQEKRFWFTPHRRNQRSQQEAYKEWEQACRQRWRALVLCVKAKLEAVNAGITTFESEFLAHFVLKDGRTYGDAVIPQLDNALANGRMPLLLTDASSLEAEVIK